MKVKENFEYVNCNLCGSNDFKILFKGRDMVHKKKGLFTVVKCNNCDLVYINPRPNSTIISEYYPDEYWDISEDDKNMKTHFKEFIHKFINKISYKITIPPQYGGKILDIGCGDGKGLLKLKESGWETYGVETSDLAADYVRRKYNINVITGTVEDAVFKDEFFDVIILSHVLEHISNPKTTLLEINRILKNGGILVISIPNVDSFEAKTFKKYWTAWELPRHLYHFTPTTIYSLLNSTGFDVLDIEFDNNPNILLSSLKYVFEGNGLNPNIGLILLFPFAILLSLILSKTERSYNMAVYSKKR